MANASAPKNPRRVAAGRENRKKWRGFSADGLQRLRDSALQNKPWLYSTGPKTAAGKAKVALNGKARQKGPRSVREVRAEVAGLNELLNRMYDARQAATATATR